jgi:hypothetical protein
MPVKATTPCASIDRSGCISVVLQEKSGVKARHVIQAEGKVMKEVAMLLLVAVMLNGCGANTTATQTAASGLWSATLVGGEGMGSGFSFTTQFTVSGGGGALSISSFQFLTAGACFPPNGETPTGQMILTENTTTFQVTGPVTFTVQSGGNTLTMNGTVTGTENGVNGTTLAGAVATGTWMLTGTAPCDGVTGSFTMSQKS